MFDPNVLRREMDFYNRDISERSVDDYLDSTELFSQWAREKGKGTNVDPENRKPAQVRDFRMGSVISL